MMAAVSLLEAFFASSESGLWQLSSVLRVGVICRLFVLDSEMGTINDFICGGPPDEEDRWE
jgi:hypothetical protein